ncbi:gliding motility-associated C-terminal domain-containing protein [Olleya sp. HaHaR_3_96]|uniref:T9SS type B sorting domain-containing protein n=1 Tax=Olleya sp. HaHaR_3_96 TaxID=2745560 RepID=UPI001C4EB8B7|nr:gliding motility-associated C-terminal domain-containing protein [Olleya sp. HaHaR_3_96]QXP58807.1 gliding motility-associated C-terminal domain-containing protein [Olleya sp. HaHaR_3_96]
MQTKKKQFKLRILVCLLIFTVQQTVNSQIVISSPNLNFSQACANENFNTYSVTFLFNPENELEPSNEFSLELSDADGDFANPVALNLLSSGAVTSSPATLTFEFPNTVAGENYRIRVKSTAPVATSGRSQPFAAYYKLQDSPFTINNLIETGVFCSGGSYLLTIDNPGSGGNDSPLAYPSLTYNWYQVTGPTTSVFVASGSSLMVTQEGTYFVETDYGTCTSDSFSNRVTITEVGSGGSDAGISASLGTLFCPDQGPNVLSTITGDSYQWFENGSSISGATSQMYETTESGTYTVQVDLGGCVASGEITIVSQTFEASINVEDTNTIEEGESLSVVITNTAILPEFEWYLDDVLISTATTDSFEATDYGNYTVIVTQSTGCEATKIFSFEISEPFDPFPDVDKIPNLISPNGDGINDTWIIPAQYVVGSNTQVTILTNRGEVVVNTDAYLNNWPEDDLNLTSINLVFYYIITTSDNEVKKGSITIIK